MKKYLKFVIVGLIALIVLYFVFAKKKSVENKIDDVLSGGRCLTPPENFDNYDSKNIKWGEYAGGIREHIGDYEDNVSYVSSFLKGLDVQPKRAYVKYYQDEIKAYIKSKRSLPSWEIEVGQFSCKSNGMLPEDVVLP